jgi:hypothetical protein
MSSKRLNNEAHFKLRSGYLCWYRSCVPGRLRAYYSRHETTTTRQYDTTNPPIVMAPVANRTTTTTTDNGTVQRTYTQPAPYSPQDQSTTTVTTDTNNGTVQKRTTTTYQAPY